MALSLPKLLVAIRHIIGLAINALILNVMAFVINGLDTLTRLMVKGVEMLTGAEIPDRPYNPQRYHNKPVYDPQAPNIINEAESLKHSKFAFTPEQLIEKTRTFLEKENAFGAKKIELLAENFQFVFPVVGPLTKEEFSTAFTSFKVDDAFPNSQQNFFGFTVDPLETNRVWFFSRAEMVHTGALKFGSVVYPPTNKTVIHTPQVFSVTFDDEGRVSKFTGGYSVDRTIGNAGGLGGLFGIIHAIGGSLPFPEGKPWKPSLQWEAFKRIPEIGKEWTKAKN